MTRTAKQRIERAVKKEAGKVYPKHLLTIWVATRLILAERARLKREVKKLPRILGATTSGQFYESVQLRDVLALWEK